MVIEKKIQLDERMLEEKEIDGILARTTNRAEDFNLPETQRLYDGLGHGSLTQEEAYAQLETDYWSGNVAKFEDDPKESIRQLERELDKGYRDGYNNPRLKNALRDFLSFVKPDSFIYKKIKRATEALEKDDIPDGHLITLRGSLVLEEIIKAIKKRVDEKYDNTGTTKQIDFSRFDTEKLYEGSYIRYTIMPAYENHKNIGRTKLEEILKAIEVGTPLSVFNAIQTFKSKFIAGLNHTDLHDLMNVAESTLLGYPETTEELDAAQATQMQSIVIFLKKITETVLIDYKDKYYYDEE